MPPAVAGVLRNILQFTSLNTRRLADSPRLMLESDLVRLLSVPRTSWRFNVPPGTGLTAALTDIFRLYSALHYLYTGETTTLYLAASSIPKAGVSWLKIIPADSDTIIVNADGTLEAFLPDPPLERCTVHCQDEYFTTPELVTWLVRRLWNFKGLREGQLEIISRLFRGKSVMGILPTGAGKSLCFQLPAMLLPGITLVVSPLKSLMRDQFANLSKLGITGADFLDSSKNADEKEQVLARLRTGQLKMLYLSPERLQIESFQLELAHTLTSFPISLFAIDEAHCISEWGHDFRPSYLRLRQFISQLKDPPVCALTATASNYVRQDILSLLGLNTQDMVTPKTLDRKEISLQVKILEEKRDHNQEITQIIGEEIPRILNRSLDSIHSDGAGVVFAPYAAPKGKNTGPMGTEQIARSLQNQGFNCKFYHSQMADEPRAAIQDGFKDNQFPLLVATKGYGMGIDKENIDYIVHACAPASLEAYYQEAGRAGRDGEHAHSVIIARPRLDKCERKNLPLPACHQGWKCEFTGLNKCDYGIQAGLLGLEYPSEQETAQRFKHFLSVLLGYADQGTKFNYVCPAQESARHQKYLYYLQLFGAVVDYRVMEYRRVAENHYDLLLQVELAGPNSLDNQFWLANKVIERIEIYKQQKINMLNTVHAYINTDSCRRRFLMQYFGDKTRYQHCNFCDNEGISQEAAPAARTALGQQELLEYARSILSEQNLPPALDLVDKIRGTEIKDDIRISSMRELEDRPYNPAALFLAGFLATENPESEAYGIRNLKGLLEIILKETPELLGPILEKMAIENPQLAYALSCPLTDQMDSHVLKQLAAALIPPEQYPDIHLTLLLPQLQKISNILNSEVTDNDIQ